MVSAGVTTAIASAVPAAKPEKNVLVLVFSVKILLRKTSFTPNLFKMVFLL
jgi:hypothetical protein